MIFILVNFTAEKQRTLQEFEDAITLSDKYNKTSDKIDKTMRQVHFLSFKSIAMATNNFSIENKLGEGGFGPVYKVSFVNILLR